MRQFCSSTLFKLASLLPTKRFKLITLLLHFLLDHVNVFVALLFLYSLKQPRLLVSFLVSVPRSLSSHNRSQQTSSRLITLVYHVWRGRKERRASQESSTLISKADQRVGSAISVQHRIRVQLRPNTCGSSGAGEIEMVLYKQVIRHHRDVLLPLSHMIAMDDTTSRVESCTGFKTTFNVFVRYCRHQQQDGGSIKTGGETSTSSSRYRMHYVVVRAKKLIKMIM